MTWLMTPATGGAINLDEVIKAQPTATPGSTRFTLTDGSTIDVSMGADDAKAAAALQRLTDAVDPADYS